MPQVVSVNVGHVEEVMIEGRLVRTAIVKEPVAGRRTVSGVNVDGDAQADQTAHGGPSKSLYVYGAEDYDWWQRELGEDLTPGTFGENLTVRGMDLNDCVIGERWRIGDDGLVVAVTEPRIPCFKLGWRMGDRHFPARFRDAARPGTYLTIVRPGTVGAGDDITVLERPDHGVTIGTVEAAFHRDRSLAPRLLDAPLPSGWRDWARKVVASGPG